DRGCVDAGGVAGCLPDQSRQRVVYLDRSWIDASGEVASAPRGPDCWVNSERLRAAVDEESTPRKSTALRADVTDVHEPGGTQLTLDEEIPLVRVARLVILPVENSDAGRLPIVGRILDRPGSPNNDRVARIIEGADRHTIRVQSVGVGVHRIIPRNRVVNGGVGVVAGIGRQIAPAIPATQHGVPAE